MPNQKGEKKGLDTGIECQTFTPVNPNKTKYLKPRGNETGGEGWG